MSGGMILPFLSFLFDVKPVFSLRIVVVVVVVVGVVVKEDCGLRKLSFLSLVFRSSRRFAVGATCGLPLKVKEWLLHEPCAFAKVGSRVDVLVRCHSVILETPLF
jgi:hypothetical protein